MSKEMTEFNELLDREKKNIEDILDSLKKTNSELIELDQKFTEEYNSIVSSVGEKEKTLAELTETRDKLQAELKMLEEDVGQLKPQITSLDEEENQKNNRSKELSETITKLSAELQEKKSNLEVAKKELHLKNEAMASLTKSINEDVEKAMARVEEAKTQAELIPQKNLGTSFLLDRGLEGPSAPKAEIITIVAAEEPISTEEIKQKVTSISPVQVSRFITMLEADGKIHPTEDGKWELDKEFLKSLGI